jgi:hypothetical protein
MILKRSFFIPLLSLMLVMGALFFSSPAYAADISNLENLSVDAVWLEGDMLNINVTDKQNGVRQTISLPIGEYAGNSEYVSVQAVDRNGNISNTIQFKNPFYTPPAEPEKTPGESESAIPDGTKPFTPDGTGTVVDNVTDGDGKEFFSIGTEDGNVFYLIVDRQRNTDNVYLLNAVTEQDLMSLAKPGDGSVSAIPPQTQPANTPAPPNTTETPEPEQPTAPPANKNSGMSGGTIIFILIAAAVVGGAGYYFKILLPKKQGAGADDDGIDDYEDDDSDYEDGDYGDPGEDGDRE